MEMFVLVSLVNKKKIKVNTKGGNMKKLGYILFLSVFFIGGCTKIVIKKESIETSYKTFKGVVEVDITVEDENKSEDEIRKLLALKAQKQGILEVARKWVNHSIILKQGRVKKNLNEKIVNLNTIHTNFHPLYDDMTGTYEGKFKCFVELDPVSYLTGTITGIEGGYSIATSHIAIKFSNFVPEQNTYFIIAKKNEFGAGNYYQVVGVGRIYNNLDMISQGEILTSNRSIKKKDLVFLLKTKIIPAIDKGLKREEKNQIPVVKVHPILEKKQNSPKEMK